MFITEPTGSLAAGFKASIYKPRLEATNELIAVVLGHSEVMVLDRARAVIAAIEKLEK